MWAENISKQREKQIVDMSQLKISNRVSPTTSTKATRMTWKHCTYNKFWFVVLIKSGGRLTHIWRMTTVTICYGWAPS